VRYIAALALAASLSGQAPRFDVQSRLVQVPVTVTDAKGRSVEDLGAADFAVLDEGRPQTAAVDSIATGVAPIALVVAVQSSGISAAALAKVRRIGSMIQPLVTGEFGCAALVTFAERVEWRQDCTNDPGAISRAFRAIEPGEAKRARLLDAAYEGVERLRRRPNEARRVLLLISESRDRGSETDLQTVVIAAHAAGVTVYAAPYSAFKTAFTAKPGDAGEPPQPAGPEPRTHQPAAPASHANIPVPPVKDRVDILGGIGEWVRLRMAHTTQALAGATGGATFPFARQRGIEDAIEKLGAELHTQYVLSFTPREPAPGYHRLEVRVARRGEFRIRARPGYWAAREPR